MKRVSITEARRQLPQLVRQLKQKPGSVVQITARNEVVAELRAALPVSEPEPGAAARALLEMMRKLPKHRGRRRNISGHLKDYLLRMEIPLVVGRPSHQHVHADARAAVEPCVPDTAESGRSLVAVPPRSHARSSLQWSLPPALCGGLNVSARAKPDGAPRTFQGLGRQRSRDPGLRLEEEAQRNAAAHC